MRKVHAYALFTPSGKAVPRTTRSSIRETWEAAWDYLWQFKWPRREIERVREFNKRGWTVRPVDIVSTGDPILMPPAISKLGSALRQSRTQGRLPDDMTPPNNPLPPDTNPATIAPDA